MGIPRTVKRTISMTLRHSTMPTRPAVPFSSDASAAGLPHFDVGAGTTAGDVSGAPGGPSQRVQRVGGFPTRAVVHRHVLPMRPSSVAILAVASLCLGASCARTTPGAAQDPERWTPATVATSVDDAGRRTAPTLTDGTLAASMACPPDMVHVGESLCIDRYEVTLADARTGRALSPHHPILSDYAAFLRARARDSERLVAARRERETAAARDARDAGAEALGSTLAAAEMAFPPLEEFQRTGAVEPVARARPGVLPSGHVSGLVARAACHRAGKRLCKLGEWRTACRGGADRQFPYGETHRRGVCNLARGRHPSRILFGDPSASVIDPRLNLMTLDGKPLLLLTGEARHCASAWGDDAVHDMVGNLDEWVEDDARPSGAEPRLAFAGGSYARYTKLGCAWVIRAHPAGYWDYSTGARCCADAAR